LTEQSKTNILDRPHSSENKKTCFKCCLQHHNTSKTRSK